MRVPLRRFLQELLGGFRRTIPEYTTATAASAIAADRPETVALETRQGSIRTERKVLVTICPKMCAIFAKGEHGKVATWEMDYSKDVVESVVGSTPANKCAKPKPLSGEPRRIAPFFLYETMKFSLSWDIPQLKLWAQVAFLERLCYPGVDLEQIPVLDAVRIVCDYAETEEVGSRMILCGLVIVLNIMHSCTALNDCHALKDLERLMAPKRTLWKNVIKPGKLCPDSSVQVKTAGKTVCVPVNMGFWVYQLKCKIQGTECIPVDQQRLCFNGRELSDNISLADYGITKEAVLTLIPKVKGCQ
ncbi:uncharacterized protein LOC129598453 isoform X2 [Paramacrobiotus metropolitanus]|uniref:uncharacterized protein LOC129598453 isoform X2 n=1 Tax=Paramacrobiotus metropolitanus TaxID=2943436 RepID=UPI002445F0AA|nr:uncharacterized protein LOC129598453 isoform X2 [Paramacrobiotus metropolitanus]